MTDWSLTIDVKELRKVIDHVLGTLESETIVIHEDYYWNIPSEELFDSDEPTSFNLGQLSWEWPDLLALLSEREIFTGSALIWLSAVFRAMGEEIINPENSQVKPDDEGSR